MMDPLVLDVGPYMWQLSQGRERAYWVVTRWRQRSHRVARISLYQDFENVRKSDYSPTSKEKAYKGSSLHYRIIVSNLTPSGAGLVCGMTNWPF